MAYLAYRRIRDVAAAHGRSYGAAHARIQRSLASIPRIIPAPFTWNWLFGHELVLVADALWLRVNGQRVTVYIVLLREIDSTTAHLVIAHPLPGTESGEGWRRILSALPRSMREWITTATIDGHGGLHGAIEDLCSVPGDPVGIQWCQFHCKRELLRRVGKKAIERNRATRLCWDLALRLLDTPQYGERRFWWALLALAARLPACPERTWRAVLWFRMASPRATIAYRYTCQHVPTTSNSAEAMCKALRRILRKVRPSSAERVLLACRLLLRRNPTVTCRGWNS